jgi:hypothetical protein
LRLDRYRLILLVCSSFVTYFDGLQHSLLLIDRSYLMRSSWLKAPPRRSKPSSAGNLSVGVCWTLSLATNAMPGQQIPTP